MKRWRRRLAGLALTLAFPGFAAAQPVAIVGGEVHTGAGEVLAGATVVIEDGKITAIGPGAEPPEGAEVISAEGMVVTPGFIDAQTFLGSGPTAGGALINLVGEPGAAIAPEIRAVDRFAEGLAPLWLRSGVTAVYLAPDPRLLIGGTGAVVKLAGPPDTAIVAEETAVAASFGETAVGDAPPGREAPVGRTTRQGMIYDFRSTLIRAGEDAIEGQAAGVMGRLLAGELPLRMLANKPDDIETALRVAGEFDLRLVLDQAAGAAAVASRLAEAGVPVVVGPSVIGIGDGGPMELKGHSPATAGVLHEAGVRIALSTFGSRGRSVAMEAIVAWAHGLPREAALGAVTSASAAILGVDGRIGSLAVGLDGDVVIWDSHPIGTYARTAVVLVDGAVVFRR
jgi:imidazolonepropionase-like amidohydrolase